MPRRTAHALAGLLAASACLFFGTASSRADDPPVSSPVEPPANLTPVVSPAKPNEGVWSVALSLQDQPVMWTTQIRPFAHKKVVLASAVAFDQSRLHAALYVGTKLPGKGRWNRYKKVSGAALPALVAAFNGGFEFRHIRGGFFTEGRVAKKLLPGQATLGIRPDGTMSVGVLGWDMVDDGGWASLRQNLPPVVWQGQNALHLSHQWVYWGNNFGGQNWSRRSAICTRADGRLMYVMVGMVNVDELVDVLLSFGCQTGMQLDMNGTWPQFTVFDQGLGTATRKGHTIDARMWPWNRYLVRSTKDFIALFDPSLLPDGAVA
jgi:hypothetical protein